MLRKFGVALAFLAGEWARRDSPNLCLIDSSHHRVGLITTASSAAPAASTFVLDGGDGTNLTFAVNLPSTSEDLYFHLSGPAGNDWISVGMGNKMKGSLMLIAYAAANGHDITLSPRIGTGNNEPTYTKDVSITLLPGSGIINSTYIVNAKCTGCRTWKGGSIDLKSQNQPMIYAVGPGDSLQSNALDASIRRHADFGESTVFPLPDPTSLYISRVRR